MFVLAGFVDFSVTEEVFVDVEVTGGGVIVLVAGVGLTVLLVFTGSGLFVIVVVAVLTVPVYPDFESVLHLDVKTVLVLVLISAYTIYKRVER